MRFPFRTESIIGNNYAAFGNFFPMQIDSFLIQSDQTIHALSDGCDFFRRNTERNRRMSPFDTGSKETLAEKRVSLLGKDTSQNFSARLDTLALLSSHFPNKILLFHSIFLLTDE